MSQYFCWFAVFLPFAFAGCTSRAPFYVEAPLSPTPRSAEDARPPSARVDAPRSLQVRAETLPNGMVASVVERPGSGLVSLVYVNRRARLGDDYAPVFVGDALLAGAFGRDDELLYPLTVGGESPLVLTGSSGTTIRVTCTAQLFEHALEQLAALVQRPAFDPTWLAPVRSRAMLDLLGMRNLYGDWSLAMAHVGRPFELSVEAVAEQVRALDRPALERVHRQLFQPEDSALVVVGEAAAPQALAAFRAKFSGWVATPPEPAHAAPAGEPSAKTEASLVTERARPRILVEEGEHYPQITLVQDAPAPDSEDAVAFELLRGVLAQHGSSSLMKTLRYEQAHAYHVGARTLTVPGRGRYLLLETSVAQETLAGDLSEMLAALSRLRTTLIDEPSLTRAKAHYSAQIAKLLSSGAGVAGYLAQAYLRETPSLQAVQAKLAATSAEDVRRVAARYLAPERATVSITGAVAASGPALQALGDVSSR